MARKKKAAHSGGGVHSPAWMISWADLTTLLWACFVLLWSFSTLDLVKFQQAMASVQGAFGVLEGGAMVLNPGDIPSNGVRGYQPSAGRNRMESIRDKIETAAQESGYSGSIDTFIETRGLMIRFSDTALFDSGSKEIKPGVFPVLNAIATELAQISNPVQVEGHTDSTPIHTAQFPSNWELSTGRAAEIVHYLIEFGGVPPDRLSAAGYAYYHPVAPNSTAEGRAKNRRVDVIVLNALDEEAEVTESREDALSYLESSASTGIIMPTVDDSEIDAGGVGQGSSEEEDTSEIAGNSGSEH